MGRHGRKRSHAQFSQDLPSNAGPSTDIGTASTLAHIQNTGSFSDNTKGWNLVEGRSNHSKKAKRAANRNDVIESRQDEPKGGKKKDNCQDESRGGKKKDNRPALTVAELHKIHSSLKITDLQGLVLYCLADGTSPQWISVRHHAQVKKAVVLMVPGLEKDMFNGHMKLGEADFTVEEATSVLLNTIYPDVLDESNKDLNTHQASQRSPDNYLPVVISNTTLPAPLKPLANIFNYLWPVKAPGDDNFSKLHSPTHAMLNSPIPKTQEEKRAEKNIKGPKPAREAKFWENKRTSITAFIASKEELQDNEYTLHPCCIPTSAELECNIVRRRAAKETVEHGWVDTRVQSLEEANTSEGETEQGSMTAGRTVLSMDCEMCRVEGGDMALTRISIVAWDGSVVMDEFVKPDKPITDYLTPYVSSLIFKYG